MRTTSPVTGPPPSPARRLPLLLLVPLLLTACGSGSGSGGASGDGNRDLLQDLDGRNFVISDLDDDRHEIVPGSTIRLTFADGRVGVHAGCNQMSGEVSVDDGRLSVGALASTEMACDPPLMDQDGWVAAFLSGGPAVELSGPSLTLTSADATLHLEEEVAEDTPLEGTVWRLESLLDGNDADGTVSTPPLRATATLRIDGATLTLDTGCNTGSASVEHGDGELQVGPLRTTLRDCGRPMRDLEKRFHDVLTPPTAYVIEGPTLTLWAPGGDQGLGFRAG